jgi:antitoxin (DNA-binding transcriptional repressor) of toxin-antitoxin stability system
MTQYCLMEKATIPQLKSRLSAYLKKVKAGQAILILDRDQPIARLERVEPGTHPGDRLVRLERAGLLRRATRPVSVAKLSGRASKSRRSVVEALLEERREGR